MMTANQRAQQLHKVANDDLLTTGDKFKYIYHWMKLELALSASIRADKRCMKHAKALRQLVEVFNFQHDLEKL